jgi:hypothetical protein
LVYIGVLSYLGFNTTPPPQQRGPDGPRVLFCILVYFFFLIKVGGKGKIDYTFRAEKVGGTDLLFLYVYYFFIKLIYTLASYVGKKFGARSRCLSCYCCGKRSQIKIIIHFIED